MAKIISYNVNGIRSATKKGLADWLKAEDPDIVCLQELKAQEDQIEKSIFEDLGYQIFVFPAVKKGYSGVGILTKLKPLHVEHGCGIPSSDDEGRTIRADFQDFSVMSVYVPSGTTGDVRQTFKMDWLDDFFHYTNDLKKSRSNLIISGDFNICHKPIDIHDPVSNKNSSGFLPEEREWISKFLDNGFLDSFRVFNSEPHHYTWWTFRANARTNNKGWRIDYHMTTSEMRERLTGADILPDVVHSDHCPISIEITGGKKPSGSNS